MSNSKRIAELEILIPATKSIINDSLYVRNDKKNVQNRSGLRQIEDTCKTLRNYYNEYDNLTK